jgi:hypothetical protein
MVVVSIVLTLLICAVMYFAPLSQKALRKAKKVHRPLVKLDLKEWRQHLKDTKPKKDQTVLEKKIVWFNGYDEKVIYSLYSENDTIFIVHGVFSATAEDLAEKLGNHCDKVRKRIVCKESEWNSLEDEIDNWSGTKVVLLCGHIAETYLEQLMKFVYGTRKQNGVSIAFFNCTVLDAPAVLKGELDYVATNLALCTSKLADARGWFHAGRHCRDCGKSIGRHQYQQILDSAPAGGTFIVQHMKMLGDVPSRFFYCGRLTEE